MRWSDFKENKTQYISHLSQRVRVGDVSRVREKNMRMSHAFIAHDEVFCLQKERRSSSALTSKWQCRSCGMLTRMEEEKDGISH